MPNLNGTFMLYSIIAALILNVTQRLEVSCTTGFMEQDKKIAFLFLARRHMPLEDIWKEFFGWKANSSHYTIYVHPEQGFKYHNTSFFYGREIQSVHNVKWGGMSQVRAIKNLVKEALKDPLNEWFCLMSESCIPLHPFPVWRKAFAIQEKSIVNACAMSHGVMETETRWRPSLDDVSSSRIGYSWSMRAGDKRWLFNFLQNKKV